MSTTLDALEALKSQQAHNAAYSEIELAVARADGADALTAAMGRGETIMLMDEASANYLQNAYAIGWNTEWADIQYKMSNEVKSLEDAQHFAVDYADKHNADSQIAKKVALDWFKTGEGAERQ